MKLSAKVFLGIALFSLASSVNPGTARAALIERDLLVAGDKLLTVDTATGLEWLDLTATRGLSYNQVAAGAGGWTSLGFRFGTQNQVNQLYVDAGITLGLSEANVAPVATLLTLMGCLYADCGLPSLHSGASGFVDLNVFSPTTALEMFVETFPDTTVPGGQLAVGSLIGGPVSGFLEPKDAASPAFGSYLYRTPESATLLLLAVGFVGLALVHAGKHAVSRRRKGAV